MYIMSKRNPSFYEKGEINKSTIWSFFSILSYKITLDLSFYYIVSPVWGYMRFEFQFNIIKFIESFILLFIVFLVMPKSSKKLSNIMIWLFILLSYVPMLTIFALKDESRLLIYSVTVFWIVVILLLQAPSVDLNMLKRSWLIRSSLFTCISLLTFIIISKYIELSINLDLSKVYEIRSEFSRAGIPLAGYLFNWQGYIVNPVFFSFFCIKKKWIFVALIVFLQLLLFSGTGNKTYLFALVFVSFLMWSINRKNPLGYIAFGITGIIFLGMLTYWAVNDVWISSLFTRRTLLDQAQQYFFYHDFFSKNSYTFLSQHRLFQIFLDYPYHLDPPNLIGEVYYGNPENSANTGIIGDAYMNFGFAGLAIWSVLISIILKIIDSFSKWKYKKISIAAIAMPSLTLINSALLTNFLTHGLLLALLLLYFLPKAKQIVCFQKSTE